MLCLLAGLLPCAVAQTPARTAGESDYEGRVIKAITFVPADQPLTEREIARKLTLHPGSLFRGGQVRQSIQNLFASGRYADIAVDAEPDGAGMSLRFLTKPAYFVGRVLIEGIKQPPNADQLSSAAKLSLGAPYQDNERKQAVNSISDVLHANGFYHASVDSSVRLHPDTESADVTLSLDPGDRARFTEPKISGHPERNMDSIVRSTRWKRLYGLLGWQYVTESRLRQGVDNLRRYYEKRDRLQSSVTLSGLNYSNEANTVEPHLRLEAGPQIVLSVDGANISRHQLNELVPIYQEKSIDSDLLDEGQRNIAEYLQAEGYLETAVSYEVQRRDAVGGRVITYHVTLGPRHKFVALRIDGNHYFPDDLIREHFYVQPAEFPRFPYGRFSAAYLKQDLQSIQTLYLANGFRDVRISSRLVDNYHGVKNHLAAVVSIDEGPQWLVSRLEIQGVPEPDLRGLRWNLASLAGQPFSPNSIVEDRETLLEYFYTRGFSDASFEFYQTPSADSHKVNLRYVITPGEREYVRKVIVTGLETTRPNLVLKRIELQQGQPFSRAAETDSQRRLYDLGIFARVNTGIQNPDGDEDQKYVLYDIDEAKHYSLNLGFGAQIARLGGGATSLDNPAGSTGFAPRLAVGITRINFLGLGQTVGLQTAVSTIEQRAALTYFIPQFGSHPNLSLTTTGLVENSNDIRTYTAHRREGSIQLGQKVGRGYTVQYRLVFRNVTISNLKIDPLLVPLLSQPERLGLGELSIIRDHRDDPADAHHGSYSTADLSYAPRFLGSQTSFLRGLFRNSTYHPFHRDFVFARSTQFGVITRLGGAADIPLAERLYSGGSTSLRSFPDFQAGPRDLLTGFVLGGNASFVNTFELRFPLYGDNLGGVLFEDAGNVYSSLSDFSFRFRQENLQDFNYMVQSAGIGIRYQTPIGPVRLDFSFSPDAPRFFGLKGTLEDLINNTAVSTVQKINAFQFHFSLGQAF